MRTVVSERRSSVSQSDTVRTDESLGVTKGGVSLVFGCRNGSRSTRQGAVEEPGRRNHLCEVISTRRREGVFDSDLDGVLGRTR